MGQRRFVDLHIHIGRTRTGKPVKITASNHLTLSHILMEASQRKGLDMIGIIDAHVPEVQAELKSLIRSGDAQPLQGGGIRYGRTTLLLGTEMEMADQNSYGAFHVLCYFPGLEEMAAFSQWMSKYQKNMTLSSQRSYVRPRAVQQKVKELQGLFIPAHIFTPYKSLYGKGVHTSVEEVLDPQLIDAMELGLSSNTWMADQLPELQTYPFVANSDAHSLPKIGREYQMVDMDQCDFVHLRWALAQQNEQSVVAYYGLDPQLGKYHQEVSARIHELEIRQKARMNVKASYASGSLERPPYIHQVPLEFIPGLGPKGLNRLVQAFGTEMGVIHSSTRSQLEQWVSPSIADSIMRARHGQAQFEAGGAGKYGKMS